MEHEPSTTKSLFERRHYKALCKATHDYWQNGGPDLLEHLIEVLSAFDNFSEVRFRRMWEQLCEKETDDGVSVE